MRGKAAPPLGAPVRPGITPAYAGKSDPLPAAPAPVWDHPRVCGEKCTPPSSATTKPGSPPRMRGKGLLLEQQKNRSGITPAYAGKRPALQRRLRRKRDHPRVCGEKQKGTADGREMVGSPPRMRGKEPCVFDGLGDSGITPAYAGKRTALVPPPAPAGDHPRVCGEKDTQGSGRGSE